MSFYAFRRQLEYKAAMRGGIVQVADRWMPSSKTCSACDDKLPCIGYVDGDARRVTAGGSA
jgi:transposase